MKHWRQVEKERKLRIMKPHIVGLLKKKGLTGVTDIDIAIAVKREVGEARLALNARRMRDMGMLSEADLQEEYINPKAEGRARDSEQRPL